MLNEWLNTIGNIYWFFMLVAYPLTIRNGYHDIATSKLVFFFTFSFLFIIANLVIHIISRLKNIPLVKKDLQSPEKIILIILSITILITFIKNGDYTFNIWAPGEMHMSILFLGTLILVYFFIRQIPYNKEFVAILASAGVSLVSLLAIVQFLGLTFNTFFYYGDEAPSSRTFVATMSNRDLVGFYFIIMLPLCFYLSTNKKIAYKILGIISVILTSLGIVVSDTDAAILCFAFELVLIALISSTDTEHAKAFAINVFSIGTAFALLGLLVKLCPNTAGMAFIPTLFLSPMMAGLFVGIAVILFMLVHFNRLIITRVLSTIALIILCLYPLYILIYTLLRGNFAEDWLPFDSFLLFNDSWGSSRGYIWKMSIDLFSEGSVFDKLLGLGAQGYGFAYLEYVTRKPHPGYSLPYYDVHNMYLHYMIEYGIIGLISACSLFIYRAKMMLADTDYFFKIKGIALITSMISAIFLFFNNINMAFIPCIL